MKEIKPSQDKINPSREQVIIVDHNNVEIAVVPREEMRRRQMIHRATCIIVFNDAGHILIQKRTTSKDIYPGYYDIGAGGVVQAGESYDESAQRELFEELGITGELSFLFDHYCERDDNRVWAEVYKCRHNGPFILQKEEVASAQFMSVNAALELESLTPDGREILHRLKFSAS